MMAHRRLTANFSILILAILIASVSLTIEVKATPVIGSETITLEPVADAYVRSDTPNTNYGDEDLLYVAFNSKFDYTYLMFDFSDVPQEAYIISAELRLYLVTTGGSIYGLPADRIGVYYCSDTSWVENEITWINKPPFDPDATDTWSFSLMYYTHEYKLWDVTEDVKRAFASGKLTEVL